MPDVQTDLGIDSADLNAAIRKAAIRLLPLLAVGYGIAYMDRINIGFAALQMNADLHFSATVYGFGGGLFFVSYALLEVPSNLMLVRFGARRWLARIMLTWGLLASGMMFVKTPMQFYIMRFLLGSAEAGFFPGVVLYVSYWFPHSYRGRAVSRFYFAYTAATVLTGALAGTLLGLQGTAGLAGWQWLFLIEGIPAIVLSLIFWLALPDRPSSAQWLTQRERDALAPLLDAAHTRHSAHGLPATIRALCDRRVIALGIADLGIIGASYGAALSAPLILREVTQWAPARIGALVSMTYVGAAAAMLLNGWHSDRSRERYFHTLIPVVVVALAYVVMGTQQWLPVVIGAYMVAAIGHAAGQATFWLIPSEAFTGRLAQVGIAAIGSFGMAGAFIGPYVMGATRDYTGNYRLGLLVIGVFYTAAAIVLRFDNAQATRDPVSVEVASL